MLDKPTVACAAADVVPHLNLIPNTAFDVTSLAANVVVEWAPASHALLEPDLTMLAVDASCVVPERPVMVIEL
jgi:hypothetical protein